MAAQQSSSNAAGRYATALFEMADSAGALDRVEGELARIDRMIEASEDLRRLVRSPVFGADEQGRAMAAILAKAGIAGLTANFVGVVARNRRLIALRDMIASFRALLAEKRGEMTAEVTSAHALSADEIEKIKATLKQSMGRDVLVDTKVDPSLLGGLLVKVGSRMIDSSIRTKLNTLKFAMKEAG